MAKWEFTNNMKYPHAESGACALGWGEVMIVGNPLGVSKSEILQKHGNWEEIADYPVNTR